MDRLLRAIFVGAVIMAVLLVISVVMYFLTRGYYIGERLNVYYVETGVVAPLDQITIILHHIR
ncbi:MAG TPA: hypothetical protein VE818_07380 [Nitrososphaeraceae archaeon]|nr:hypothetical protein [Nitrososphaeraceae archaeon]